MNTKHHAFWAAIFSGITEAIAWLVTMTPEQQSGVLGILSNAFPESWKPTLAIVFKALGGISAVYAIYRASQSGPPQLSATPPAQPPQKQP